MTIGSLVSRAHALTRQPAAEVPRWLWLWVPPLMIAAQLTVLAWDRGFYDRYIESESGIVENATALFLIPAILAGILVLRQHRLLANRLLTLWVAAVTLGCVYFAGEEVSWGQHWFGWQTPELIARLNDQGETSLHNMSSWLDQKPRTLLLLWVVVGGIAYPIWARLRSRDGAPVSTWQGWFWPRYVCMPAAMLAILVRLPEYAREWLDAPLPSWLVFRASEPQEYCFALFLLVYTWSLYLRLREHGAQPIQPIHRTGGVRDF